MTMITAKCRICDTELLNYNQAYIQEFHGALCPTCFHKLPWKDKAEHLVSEFIHHVRDGWMLARYHRKDFNIKEPWMLPLPRDTKVFIPLKEEK